jgi:hypothetical protein
VANGRQAAVRHVSSDLSKIPYGGFSPVRLQTGSVRRHLRRLRRLIGGLKRRRPPDLGLPALRRGEGRVASAFRSRGPWLGVGLFCPAASSLTTASSELLAPSGRLMVFARRSSPHGRVPGGPCFHLRVLPFVPPSVPRQTGRPEDDSTSARVSLRPNARGSASAVVPLESVHVGCPNEAAKFARCCGPNGCLPFTDKDVYVRAFIPMSHLIRTSNMTTRVNRQSPAAGLTPAGSAALQAAPHSGHRSGVARRS